MHFSLKAAEVDDKCSNKRSKGHDGHCGVWSSSLVGDQLLKGGVCACKLGDPDDHLPS